MTQSPKNGKSQQFSQWHRSGVTRAFHSKYQNNANSVATAQQHEDETRSLCRHCHHAVARPVPTPISVLGMTVRLAKQAASSWIYDAVRSSGVGRRRCTGNAIIGFFFSLSVDGHLPAAHPVEHLSAAGLCRQVDVVACRRQNTGKTPAQQT